MEVIVTSESNLPALQVSSHDNTSASSTAEDEEVKELLKHKPPLSPHHHQSSSPLTNTSTSPTPSTESESSSLAEGTRPSPPPCSLRERVQYYLQLCNCVIIMTLCRLWWKWEVGLKWELSNT